MHGDDIEVLEHALVTHIGNKHWVNGGNATEHAQHMRVFGGHSVRCDFDHVRKNLPVRVYLKGPVRFVIGLVPEHNRFNHGAPPVGWLAAGLDRRHKTCPTGPDGGT